MGKSIREYLIAVVKWWWVMVIGFVLGAVGAIREVIPQVSIHYEIWFGVFILGLFVAQFLTFHNIRVDRDKLLDKAKPKLKFEGTVEQIRDQIGESFCLEISNQGSDLTTDCRGMLIAVEFAIEQKGLSMCRWPVNCPLMMDSSIGGQLSSVLEVIHKEPSSHTSFEYHFAYANNANGMGLRLPTGQDILVIVGVSSLNACPLYTVCIFRGLHIPAPTKFEIVDSNLEECPTIAQCRQMLTAHNAKTKTQ